jgi:ElaB/YqjD/DUF883 family membrane-anchored ribosome-binding protein
MDKESDLMNEEPDEIRDQIEDTRSALTAKLETLEQGVKETVSEAKAAVTDTIENVKETVKGTVETVKESLDIRSYVQEHPWPMMAGSVVFGWALGYMFPRSTNGDKISRMASNGTPMEARSRFESTVEDKVPPSHNGHKNGASSLIEKFRPEINELEGIAIGAIGALVRDLIKQSAAEPLAERLEDVANRVTEKLGGRVMHEPLLDQSRS